VSRILSGIIHLYSWLIRFYPASFREEFSSEMVTVFYDLTREAVLNGNSQLPAIILREFRDYPFSLLREHWHNIHQLESNLMTTIRKPEWFFIPAWVFFTAICMPITFILYFAVIRFIMIFVGDVIYVNGVRHITEDYLFTYLFPPMVGLLTGRLQYGLLRRYLSRMGWWVAATLAGWLGLVLILGIFSALAFFWTADVANEFLINWAFVVLGLSIGVGQWLLLRRRLPQAAWWIAANIAGWTLLGLLGLIVGGNGSLNQYTLLAVGILPACVTAMALVLLMNQDPPPKPQGV
jgi:hypothetical protein